MTRTIVRDEFRKVRMVTRRRTYMGNPAGFNVHLTTLAKTRDGQWRDGVRWKQFVNVLTAAEALDIAEAKFKAEGVPARAL